MNMQDVLFRPMSRLMKNTGTWRRDVYHRCCVISKAYGDLSSKKKKDTEKISSENEARSNQKNSSQKKRKKSIDL